MSTNLCDRWCCCWLQLQQLSFSSNLLLLLIFIILNSSNCTAVINNDVPNNESSETVTFIINNSNSNTTTATTSYTAAAVAAASNNSDDLVTTTTEIYFIDEEKNETNIIQLNCTEPKLLPNPKEICLIEHACSECDFTTNTKVILSSHDTSIITLINVNNVPLQFIPVTIFDEFTNLEILQLENCQIDELNGIVNAKKLKKLYLNHNQLRELNEGQLDGAPNLRLFEVTWNKIENVHEKAFFNTEKLYWLDLSNNRIGGLPWNVFQNLKAVVTINLSYNMIDELGLVFNGMESLSTLDLSHNAIQKIRDRTFDRTTNLEEIHLGYNQIEVLERNAFDQCSKLKLLDLSNNRLQSIHFDIPSSQFGSLLLFNNSIAELACTTRLQNLTNLKVHAHNNQISTMFIQEGIPITDCNLDNNRLKTLGTLTKIYSLTSMRLSNNDLSESDDFASFVNLQNLVELDVSATNIQQESIPYLFRLQNLIFWLDLSNNPSVADYEWGQLTESPLTVLRLNNCSLQSLSVPDLLNTLHGLHEIEIFDNQFKCSELKKILLDFAISGIDVKKGDVMTDVDSINGIQCNNDTISVEPSADEIETPTLLEVNQTTNVPDTMNNNENITKLVLQPKVTQIKPIESDTAGTQEQTGTKLLEVKIIEPTPTPSPSPLAHESTYNTRPRIQIRPHVPTSSSSSTSNSSSATTTTTTTSPSPPSTTMPITLSSNVTSESEETTTADNKSIVTEIN